ncbi:unnamed protein product [Caenorhabditis sp. 36 PRJEB53466]|nr:unnamed protein product [Caenorhabditis sp. 36 PRJEB53466]
MPMYQLTPTFPANFDVTPKEVIYRVASYHESTVQAQQNGQVQQETDPRKVLEQKQLELIETLKAQTDSLNKLLVSLAKVTGEDKKATPAKKEQSVPAAVAPASADTTGKDGKKDKDAKKEARKAAKAEAVKKLASGEAPIPKGKTPNVESNGWTVEDDRKTWEDKLSLTVNIPTSLVSYPQEHLGQATLTVTAADQQWVAILAKSGEKRQVAFTGDVSNKANDAKTTIKVTKGSKTTLAFAKTTATSLQTIWKLLGAALGLFSRKSQQVLSASHQALWLNQAEQIVHGSGDLSYATRQASQFLARFDSLSSQWEVSVADVIFRSLLNLAEAHPNNVEIWAKKIDKLLA